MAHTVESFVDALRTDGVEAGRQEAERIRNEAQQEADRIRSEAQQQAERIVQEAEQQREKTLERTQTDLELAARDIVARLRDTLNQALQRVLSREVAKQLDDSELLKKLIKDIAHQYAAADAACVDTIEFNVSEAERKQLTDWAIATFHKADEPREISMELHGSLKTAGFEYKTARGAVEVTPDAVVQVLAEIVTPELRKLIEAAEA